MAIYPNDSWLRNKILTVLGPIEVKTRTQVSHYLGVTYGLDVFYQKSVYKNEPIWQAILDNFSNEIFRNQSDPVRIFISSRVSITPYYCEVLWMGPVER
jgi:abortive infection bacteriophage resistance protein